MKEKNSLGAYALSLSFGFAISGCSSTPVPKAEIAVSKTALESALAAGGAEFAPVEVKTAQDKIEAANKAVERDENMTAKHLAEEAAVDAKLAETKALAGKAEKSLQESQSGQRALKEEMQRQTP